jgi:hypothetical protein
MQSRTIFTPTPAFGEKRKFSHHQGVFASNFGINWYGLRIFVGWGIITA